jgi:S-formylglutathione hydrolase FrmB
VVAFPDGGDSSYWHDRDGGDWGQYVVDEVIPQVAHRFGADPDRVAIGGISMGGFGAYDIARLHPDRFCAVGGHSPALWRSAGETAPGAFDDAEDFARHDVIDEHGALTGMPVWLDAGDVDPFRPGDEAFVAALEAAGADVTARTWPGGHDGDYWDRHWRDYLRFYARELARC